MISIGGEDKSISPFESSSCAMEEDAESSGNKNIN